MAAPSQRQVVGAGRAGVDRRRSLQELVDVVACRARGPSATGRAAPCRTRPRHPRPGSCVGCSPWACRPAGIRFFCSCSGGIVQVVRHARVAHVLQRVARPGNSSRSCARRAAARRMFVTSLPAVQCLPVRRRRFSCPPSLGCFAAGSTPRPHRARRATPRPRIPTTLHAPHLSEHGRSLSPAPAWSIHRAYRTACSTKKAKYSDREDARQQHIEAFGRLQPEITERDERHHEDPQRHFTASRR